MSASRGVVALRPLAGAAEPSPSRWDLGRLSPAERVASERLMRDPSWCGTARLGVDWVAVWWFAGTAAVFWPAALVAVWWFGLPALAVVLAGYLLALVTGAHWTAPRRPAPVSWAGGVR